jgi:hypothetical protein
MDTRFREYDGKEASAGKSAESSAIGTPELPADS